MRITIAALAGITTGICAATYCRRYFGSFVTWAFSRGDTPR